MLLNLKRKTYFFIYICLEYDYLNIDNVRFQLDHLFIINTNLVSSWREIWSFSNKNHFSKSSYCHPAQLQKLYLYGLRSLTWYFIHLHVTSTVHSSTRVFLSSHPVFLVDLAYVDHNINFLTHIQTRGFIKF